MKHAIRAHDKSVEISKFGGSRRDCKQASKTSIKLSILSRSPKLARFKIQKFQNLQTLQTNTDSRLQKQTSPRRFSQNTRTHTFQRPVNLRYDEDSQNLSSSRPKGSTPNILKSLQIPNTSKRRMQRWTTENKTSPRHFQQKNKTNASSLKANLR